ncbi:MAG TPA: SDR family oxidoreductase, partial [Chthoniobacterales bacterium]
MPKTILKGSVVLIGGGGKNLGGLLSRTFAAEGAKVALHFNSESSRAEAEKTVADITAAGGEALAFQGDFTKPPEIAAFFAAAKAHFGGIDIAINTVGKVLKKPFLETTEEEYDEMAAVNAKAAYFFIQEAGRHLNDGGKILTVVTSLLAAYTGLYSTY